MQPARTTSLRRRARAIAMITLVIITCAASYHIERASPTYAESASVIFTIPAMERSGTAYTGLAASLISTGAAVSQILTGPQSRAQIAAAGGTAEYTMGLVNLYNEDYPDYGFSVATLSAWSADPAITHRTFTLALRMLADVLADRQGGTARPTRRGAVAGTSAVPAPDRIVTTVTGDSGPIEYTGSRKRALGGLALLALLAGWAAWSACGRWQPRSGGGKHGPRSPAGQHR